MDSTTSELLDEAFMVGVLSLPPWIIASALVDAVDPKNPGNDTSGRLLFKVFVAGALFHIGAEYTGFNDWYIDNGLARRKRTGDVYRQYGVERGQMGYYYPASNNLNYPSTTLRW